MATQRDLFKHLFDERLDQRRQGTLFDPADSADSAIACKECGRYLTRTPSGYLCCPAGCGRLIPRADTPSDGPLFDAD